MSSLEEVQARHRKELKALDGEKRATLKKTKATAGKGKKGKEKLEEVEKEFDTKQKELEEKHAKEIADLSNNNSSNGGQVPAADDAVATEEATEVSKATADGPETPKLSKEEEERERKQAKARRKREKAKEKELARQAEIERETAEAGPSMRQIELEQIEAQLTPLGLKVQEIASDGNCMYRAIAAALENGNTYQDTRNICADTLLKHEDEFAPFCEFDNDNNVHDFAGYVDRVRNSSDWGGHLELRALSIALQKHILVYSASSQEPLLIHPEGTVEEDDNPIRVSYHLHFYGLGEHYNVVVKADG